MILTKQHLIYSAEGNFENSTYPSDSRKEHENNSPQTSNASKPKEQKSFFAKIKQALQEWSTGDQRDLDYDDTRV
jgi:hypothetical protein